MALTTVFFPTVSTSYWLFFSSLHSLNKKAGWKSPDRCSRPSRPPLGLSPFRWALALVLPSVRLLLQKPQGRWRERHLLQRPLHLQLREPIRSRLPAGHRHPWAGQPPVAPSPSRPRPRPDPGQAAEEGRRCHAPAVRAPAKERPAAHAHGQLPRHELQEAAGEGEADGGGGAGEVHRRFPQDQDSGEVPGEEVHVAGGPAEKVPPLRQDRRCRSRIQHQFTWFFDPLLQQ